MLASGRPVARTQDTTGTTAKSVGWTPRSPPTAQVRPLHDPGSRPRYVVLATSGELNPCSLRMCGNRPWPVPDFPVTAPKPPLAAGSDPFITDDHHLTGLAAGSHAHLHLGRPKTRPVPLKDIGPWTQGHCRSIDPPQRPNSANHHHCGLVRHHRDLDRAITGVGLDCCVPRVSFLQATFRPRPGRLTTDLSQLRNARSLLVRSRLSAPNPERQSVTLSGLAELQQCFAQCATPAGLRRRRVAVPLVWRVALHPLGRPPSRESVAHWP